MARALKSLARSTWVSNSTRTISMPQLGFGTWRAEPNVVGAAVEHALRHGMRHIDCAKVYRNEPEVGNALAKGMSENKIKREELFVTSKLWTTDMHPRHVRAACEKSIADLKVDYLDLYLIHWPVAWENTGKWENMDDFYPRDATGKARQIDVPLEDTWQAMAQLVTSGLVRHLGVCNAVEATVDRLLAAHADIKPEVNQVELHPRWPQTALTEYCAERGVIVQAYSPLAVPNQYTKDAATGLFAHPHVQELAKSYNLDPALMLLQWNLQKENVVLTKSTTPSRIEKLAQLPCVGLTPALMRAIDEFGMEEPGRILNPDWFLKNGGKFFPSG